VILVIVLYITSHFLMATFDFFKSCYEHFLLLSSLLFVFSVLGQWYSETALSC